MNNALFLIDSNSFIAPYNQYYQFSIAKSFWDKMECHIENGEIAILDAVFEEINKGDDELSDWIKEIDITNYISRKDPHIIKFYADVLKYIQESGYYKNTALKEWARFDCADPWLVATAKAYDLTIVTFEKKKVSLLKKQPSPQAKIPNIAEVFGVRCCTLFDMMKELSISI